MLEMPAANEAVWRNGGSSPQKVLCEFGSLPPAGSSVEAATTPSRWDVKRKRCDSAVGRRNKTDAKLLTASDLTQYMYKNFYYLQI
jgi:hypothetical protein